MSEPLIDPGGRECNYRTGSMCSTKYVVVAKTRSSGIFTEPWVHAELYAELKRRKSLSGWEPFRNEGPRVDGVRKPTPVPPQPECIQIYFLYLQEHRRELVRRKLARQRASKPAGNLMHGRQEDLACAGAPQRLARMSEVAE